MDGLHFLPNYFSALSFSALSFSATGHCVFRKLDSVCRYFYLDGISLNANVELVDLDLGVV